MSLFFLKMRFWFVRKLNRVENFRLIFIALRNSENTEVKKIRFVTEKDFLWHVNFAHNLEKLPITYMQIFYFGAI